MTTTPRVLRAAAALALAAGTAAPALAGGTPENILLIVNPISPEAMYIANYYRAARNIPETNVLYMWPGAVDYRSFSDINIPALFGTINARALADHIDYIVVVPGTSFYVAAPNLVRDTCSPVTRFSISGAYTTAFISQEILAGGGVFPVSTGNRYSANNDEPRAFDSNIRWSGGLPNGGDNARQYFIGAMLGYTGERGNTLADILAMIDRSVAIDGTRPAGTFYFMRTTDNARSGPRHGAYDAAVASIRALGGQAERLDAILPLGRRDCAGIMTGWADPGIDGADIGILAGAICDHLTSWAATFDIGSQEKVSRWIAKGASGSWGAVEEPCNYAGKFPRARAHVVYYQGLSLGESIFRHVGFAPFQGLLYGDPMTRPYAYIPTVRVDDAPTGPVSGVIAINPVATTGNPNGAIDRLNLLIDGVTAGSVTPGQPFVIDTTTLTDGYHDLRVLASDNTLARSTGRWTGSLVVSNAGRAASLAVSPQSGDLTTQFRVTLGSSGTDAREIRLVHNGRVVAARPGGAAILDCPGLTLGAGDARLYAEVLRPDGTTVRSAPVAVSIAYSSGASSRRAPASSSYTKRIPADEVSVVELPSLFDDRDQTLTFQVLTPPTKATIISGGVADNYRILRPNAGASGTDTLTYRIASAYGSSQDAVVTLVFDTCAADFNQDGALDSDDFFDFLNAFNASDPAADFNRDGTVDSDDFFDFLNAFNAGC